MPRVKRGVMTHKRHKKILETAKGNFLGKRSLFKTAHEQFMSRGTMRTRTAAIRAIVPRALDRPHQRRVPRRGRPVLPLHGGPEQGGHRPGPQSAGRNGRLRPAQFTQLVAHTTSVLKQAARERGCLATAFASSNHINTSRFFSPLEHLSTESWNRAFVSV